ncbi:MAG TPA: peptide-methionine (S)-S-oxide reductase MsrA [Bacteroidales bacterium]|nr:peptide-methionine (S)-S-oxide reductase MsrA [Bacteroidales bacterium]
MKFLTLYALLGLMFSVEACDGQDQKSVSTTTFKESLSEKELARLDTATLAGGCFWCVEASLEQIKGVYEVVSGYAGGAEKNPTYTAVSRGSTGHTETVQVYYDPDVRNYKEILKIFFTAHDPTQLNRQGPDVGKQYRSAIFFHDAKQKKVIEEVIYELESNNAYDKPIVTEVQPLDRFWMAEEYHQDYARRNPNDGYIQAISIPKVKKVRKAFPELIK